MKTAYPRRTVTSTMIGPMTLGRISANMMYGARSPRSLRRLDVVEVALGEHGRADRARDGRREGDADHDDQLPRGDADPLVPGGERGERRGSRARSAGSRALRRGTGRGRCRPARRSSPSRARAWSRARPRAASPRARPRSRFARRRSPGRGRHARSRRARTGGSRSAARSSARTTRRIGSYGATSSPKIAQTTQKSDTIAPRTNVFERRIRRSVSLPHATRAVEMRAAGSGRRAVRRRGRASSEVLAHAPLPPAGSGG